MSVIGMQALLRRRWAERLRAAQAARRLHWPGDAARHLKFAAQHRRELEALKKRVS